MSTNFFSSSPRKLRRSNGRQDLMQSHRMGSGATAKWSVVDKNFLKSIRPIALMDPAARRVVNR